MSKPLRHPTHGNNQTSPIQLVLHSPAPSVYTAGDRVRGVARVDPTSRPQRVKLSFTGYDSIGARKNNDAPVVTNNYYKNSFLNSNSFLNEELGFFFYSQELYASPTPEASFDIVSKGTAPDGRVEFPFDFTFPPFVELPPPGPIDMWKGRPQFEHEPGHPLPPTYNFPPSTSSTSLKQAIKYYLQAEIFSTSAEKPDHMVRQHLKYMMAAPTPTSLRIAEPDPNSNSKQAFHKFVKTHRLNPDCDDTGGVLRKVKKSLTKHEAPFARFNLYAQAPPMLVIGCNLPISIALEHLDRSPEIVEPPVVFLRRIRVQLESMLYIRLCNPHLSLRDGEKLTFREDMDFRPDKIELVNKRFEFGDGELAYNGLQLADLIDTKLSQETVPSFKSYGLTLQYRLRVEIWGECAKEKFEGLALSSAVQIVSNMMMVEDAEVAALAASEAAGPPPPYAA